MAKSISTKTAAKPVAAMQATENFPAKYRPRTLRSIVGQPTAVAEIEGMFKRRQIPRTILITGQRGHGKTTLARIIANEVNEAKPGERHPDIKEITVSDQRGIDAMRELVATTRYLPSSGSFKIYILDEVHALTKDASGAILKVLEEPPKHVIWIMATNEPERMLPTLHDRAYKIELGPVAPKALLPMLNRVSLKEKVFQPPEEYKTLLLKVAQASGGNPRVALQILENLVNLDAARGIQAADKESLDAAIQSALKGIGVGAEKVAVLILLSLYRGSKRALSALGDTQDYQALAMNLLDLNGFVMERQFGLNTWMSYQRGILVNQLDKSNLEPPLELLAWLHKKLIAMRQDILLTTTSDRHVAMAGIAEMLIQAQKFKE